MGRRYKCESSACGSQSREWDHEKEQARQPPAVHRPRERQVVASAPRVASSPKPLKPGAEFLYCVQIHKAGSSHFSCSLNSPVGEGESKVIAAARRGVTGRTADGKSALKGQLVHCELVGLDQPPVPRESTKMAALWLLPLQRAPETGQFLQARSVRHSGLEVSR